MWVGGCPLKIQKREDKEDGGRDIFHPSSGSGLLQGFPAVARALGLYLGTFSAETLTKNETQGGQEPRFINEGTAPASELFSN